MLVAVIVPPLSASVGLRVPAPTLVMVPPMLKVVFCISREPVTGLVIVRLGVGVVAATTDKIRLPPLVPKE